MGDGHVHDPSLVDNVNLRPQVDVVNHGYDAWMGTRETLIDVATRLLDAGGVEAVTLREVGHQAGVSHNAPYKHFANKEALLAAVAARELTGHVDETRSVRGLMHNYVA